MFKDIISAIKPPDAQAMERCQLRVDNLTKPLHSLHSFEHIACQLAGITGNPRPSRLEKSIILMAADCGAAAALGHSGPTAAQRMAALVKGQAPIGVLAEHVRAELVVVDIGAKIAYGTGDITQGPAMTRQQAVQAIEVGIKTARDQLAQGCQVIGIGEMGAGGLLPAMTAAACCGVQPFDGITPELANLVQAAMTVNKPDTSDPLDILAKVGSLSLAGLTGVILGAAAGRAAVVLDGLATVSAALLATQITPAVKPYLLGSHAAAEPGYKEALSCLGLTAYLQLDMNLGEATGAALGLSLINAALYMLNDMKTFGEAEVAVAQDGPGALRQTKNVKD